MQAKRIKSTGELRQCLCDAIVAVQNGDMHMEAAARIGKLASQVNESFYAEMRVQHTLREAGVQVAALGELPIGAS